MHFKYYSAKEYLKKILNPFLLKIGVDFITDDGTQKIMNQLLNNLNNDSKKFIPKNIESEQNY